MSLPSDDVSQDEAAPEGKRGAGDPLRLPIEFLATSHCHVVPPRTSVRGSAPALVAIHGYGMPPAEMLAYALALAPDDTVVVVPEGPSTFYRRASTPGGAALGGWAYGWVADPDREHTDARNDRLIAAALRRAGAVCPIDPARTWLLGYSQGAGVATHFFASHPDRAAGLVGLAGGVAAAARPRLAALAGKPVLWIHGAHDASYPPAYQGALQAAWEAAGVALTTHMLDASHGLLEPARPVVSAWIEAQRHLPQPDEGDTGA